MFLLKNTPILNCPVCNRAEKRLLLRQSFGSLSKGSLLAGFDLVSYAGCGADFPKA